MTKHERFWDGNVLHGLTKHTCKPRAESVCQGRIEREQLSAALTPLPGA